MALGMLAVDDTILAALITASIPTIPAVFGLLLIERRQRHYHRENSAAIQSNSAKLQTVVDEVAPEDEDKPKLTARLDYVEAKVDSMSELVGYHISDGHVHKERIAR